MMETLGQIRNWAVLAAIAVSAYALLAAVLCDEIRRHGWAAVAFIFGAGWCLVAAQPTNANKQKWRVTYDGGIKAGTTANVVTNDTVAVYWQRDTSGGVYVPETASVYIDYRPNTETNAEWGLLAQTVVGAWAWTGTLAGATNYDYNVWAYYIPPEPVHTNGVWTYKTMRDRRGANVVPIRARVEVNGKAIATPKEVRRDEAN